MKSMIYAIALMSCVPVPQPKTTTEILQETNRTLKVTHDRLSKVNKTLDHVGATQSSMLSRIDNINRMIQIRNQIDLEYSETIGDLQRLNDPKVNDVLNPHLLKIIDLESQLVQP